MNQTRSNHINTYGLYPGDNLTLGDIEKAVKKMKPLPRMRMEVCKKHSKLLKKLLQDDTKKTGLDGLTTVAGHMGHLYGIPVYIRPYLKKIRIYTEKL